MQGSAHNANTEAPSENSVINQGVTPAPRAPPPINSAEYPPINTGKCPAKCCLISPGNCSCIQATASPASKVESQSSGIVTLALSTSAKVSKPRLRATPGKLESLLGSQGAVSAPTPISNMGIEVSHPRACTSIPSSLLSCTSKGPGDVRKGLNASAPPNNNSSRATAFSLVKYGC